MPELPEVETVRRDLVSEIAGKRITEVIVTGARTVRRHVAAVLVDGLTDTRITDIRRLGKFLLADLDSGSTLVLHLRMSGQLLWTPDPTTTLLKHTHARIFFETGEELRFVDPRTFGELWLTKPDAPELSHMGPDALTGLSSPDVLAQQIANRRSGLKTVLLNQQVVAGIGNIYSDEILFLAGLRYDRLPDSLTRPQIKKLHESIGSVLKEAVLSRGSSLRDQQYVDLYGRTGGAQRSHRVYDREGEPCVTCGTPIVRTKVGGRSSYFCRRCQR